MRGLLPLAGMRLRVPGTGAAAWHAARMLGGLGASVVCEAENQGSAADWAASGVMALTGTRDGDPVLPPGQAASAVRGALLALESLCALAGRPVALPGVGVLSERAAIMGLRRDAPRAPRGAFQVLRAADSWVGLNLARPSDEELLPAWLEDADPVLEEVVARRTASELAERARLLGLPFAVLPSGPDEQLIARGQVPEVRPFVLTGGPGTRHGFLPPTLVVDLSALWAGPLCGHLLTLAGARVVKVESLSRPDGARSGEREFYDLLHAGQESVALDFGSPEGRASLARLVEAADVVIEGSRPRALRQLGIDADEVLARARDKVWISITAYGRTGPWANVPGFGDDAALAAGLLAFDPVTGGPSPVGDAIADPVTGVNAALVAVACRMAGGTWLADLALREQIAATLELPGEPGSPGEVAAPVARTPAGRAPELGADTGRVLAELGARC
ncbi:acyl-CoA transferase/carnitine dehydratase-like protein [Amycolatopsis methanolica 239]|uniref:Acyl-CoA transferase/carnitine dehydratase-like protein n=2 Tax=Amycolatopsis methanolica TaxID=1814 RepID=A0A076MWZ2_AMYME|nr:acyl-CoA transferase/carnitine dehydratase-like protein [Amycolatopsis methanolica 239]